MYCVETREVDLTGRRPRDICRGWTLGIASVVAGNDFRRVLQMFRWFRGAIVGGITDPADQITVTEGSGVTTGCAGEGSEQKDRALNHG
jgi:hypothetical protein